MQMFTVTRYYLENGLPHVEGVTYLHAGQILRRGGEEFEIATDPRAVPLGEHILTLVGAEGIRPNLWFSYQFIDPACDVAKEVWRHPDGIVPPGHWMWNVVELGTPRGGVTFISQDEYESHCEHMRELAEKRAKEQSEQMATLRDN